jgi:hypothetical protein
MIVKGVTVNMGVEEGFGVEELKGVDVQVAGRLNWVLVFPRGVGGEMAEFTELNEFFCIRLRKIRAARINNIATVSTARMIMITRWFFVSSNFGSLFI